MHIRFAYIVLAIFLFVQNGNAGFYCHGRRGRRLVIINPPTLLDPTPFGFSQIVVDTKNAVAHVAGQNAFNVTGDLIGDTLEEQLEQTFINVGLALDAVQADMTDLLKSIVIFSGVDASTALDLLTASAMGGPGLAPPSTLFFVEALALEGILVEVQVDVAVPERFVRRLVCY
ncbi:Endoribonuclease L-PSP [Gracilaria domingensis]|nr:Endoribonuclease L-PSP [Gracilaria domingensis]